MCHFFKVLPESHQNGYYSSLVHNSVFKNVCIQRGLYCIWLFHFMQGFFKWFWAEIEVLSCFFWTTRSYNWMIFILQNVFTNWNLNPSVVEKYWVYEIYFQVQNHVMLYFDFYQQKGNIVMIKHLLTNKSLFKLLKCIFIHYIFYF